MKKSTRIDVIDLLRFIIITIFAVFHFILIFKHSPNSRFRSAYILVEFFFMLTGYLTARHFSKKRPKNGEDIAKNALSYTFNKFRSYLPYIAIALVFGLVWVFMSRSFGFTSLIADISKIPVEFLLNSVFINDANIHVGPLWFLSAMFIAFPFFSMLAQIKKHRSLRNIFCLLFVLIPLGFGNFSSSSLTGVLRAFSGMLMGLLMFDLVEIFKKKKLKKLPVVNLYLALFASTIYIITILLQRGNLITMYPQIAYCMVLSQFIILTIFFSERTVFSAIKCKFFSFLGGISLPMFLIHESIAKILYKMNLELNDTVALIIYLLITVAISSLIYIIVGYAKKSLKSRLSERK